MMFVVDIFSKKEKEMPKEVPESLSPADLENDGSLYKAPYTKILDVKSHPNADRLDICTVYGFQVIAQKNKYKVGDLVVYVPIDSILPQNLEDILFPYTKDENGNLISPKIKLNKHRVRQIRIRKATSQGMLVDPSDIITLVNPEYLKLEQDLSKILGITKYEPPYKEKGPRNSFKRNRPLENPRLHKYGGIDNIKWYPNFFDGQEVIIQEKIHGSNCRAGYLKASPNTFWKKVKNFFKLLPKYEYCYGSNNVQLQERSGYTGFYGSDVYGEVLKKVDAFNKLKPGETIYGELIGPGVQQNYDYGHKEHHFVLFDVKVEKEDGSQEYLDPEQAETYAKERGFDFVPVLYRGIFNAALAKDLSMGSSVYYPKQKVREGVIIKTRTGYGFNSTKRALKLISEDYLNDPSNTDFH